jgi:hypothetical protein
MAPPHDCPGECGRQVAYELLACRRCWYRLPSEIRASVWQSYRSGGSGSVEHNTALSAAFDWYATHPLAPDTKIRQKSGETTARCGSCQQPIRWVTTEAGKSMPLDPDPADGNIIGLPNPAGGEPLAHTLRKTDTPPADAPRFTSHWATCPTSERHRRRS